MNLIEEASKMRVTNTEKIAKEMLGSKTILTFNVTQILSFCYVNSKH